MLISKAIAVAFALTSFSFAQDVDYNDLPSQCTSVCDPVVRLTQQCDNGRSDADQLSCVCQGTNATALLPACEACFAMFNSDGHDNDVNDLVSKCSFTMTSYVTAATNSGSQPSSTISGASMTIGESVAPALTSSGSETPSGTGPANTASASASMTSSGSAAHDTGAAAAVEVEIMVGLLAGIVGVAGLL